jgi:hypothetical protein
MGASFCRAAKRMSIIYWESFQEMQIFSQAEKIALPRVVIDRHLSFADSHW